MAFIFVVPFSHAAPARPAESVDQGGKGGQQAQDQGNASPPRTSDPERAKYSNEACRRGLLFDGLAGLGGLRGLVHAIALISCRRQATVDGAVLEMPAKLQRGRGQDGRRPSLRNTWAARVGTLRSVSCCSCPVLSRPPLWNSSHTAPAGNGSCGRRLPARDLCGPGRWLSRGNRSRQSVPISAARLAPGPTFCLVVGW